MTYNEFKKKIEKLVIDYAQECESYIHVEVDVEVTEKRVMSENECVASYLTYKATTTTKIG